MPASVGSDKIERVLGIYTKLMNGEVVNKAEEAVNYNVNERSIQRDIDDIRNYMEQTIPDSGIVNDVIYDRNQKGFRLEKIYNLKLTNSEVLAICKILLDSRAFTKKEMKGMLDKLIDCCVPKANQKLVRDLIKNEEFHYIEPQHKTVFMDRLWTIGKAIQECRYIDIKYKGLKDTSIKSRKLKPLAIMFSEFYFYLVAFIDNEEVRKDFNVLNDSYPTIYRIDRFKDCKVLEERYSLPYANRFEEGEFRKRIQFMFGGKLKKIRFKYLGYSVEAILDRLPTAKVERIDSDKDGNNKIYTISAEVFGDGIDMWIKSQGDMVKDVEISRESIN